MKEAPCSCPDSIFLRVALLPIGKAETIQAEERWKGPPPRYHSLETHGAQQTLQSYLPHEQNIELTFAYTPNNLKVLSLTIMGNSQFLK